MPEGRLQRTRDNYPEGVPAFGHAMALPRSFTMRAIVESASCETHGHIFGAVGACLFCGERRPQEPAVSPEASEGALCGTSELPAVLNSLQAATTTSPVVVESCAHRSVWAFEHGLWHCSFCGCLVPLDIRPVIVDREKQAQNG